MVLVPISTMVAYHASRVAQCRLAIYAVVLMMASARSVVWDTSIVMAIASHAIMDVSNVTALKCVMCVRLACSE